MQPRSRARSRSRALAAAVVLTALPLTSVVTSSASTADDASSSARPAAARQEGAVLRERVIGHSVRGRPIKAFELGDRSERTVVLISSMHGNEADTRQILWALKDGRPIHGVHLWVVPTYNPDGVARHTRKNARGVDLNRNYPYRWIDLDGNYESGPRPKSEPETRAMMRFLSRVKPSRIISFHQPLHAVDTDTKNPAFARRVARKLHLPAHRLDCGGVCHGTMTMWYNHRFRGAALTVEYGANPSKRLMRKTAPRQVLAIFNAYRHR